MRNKTPLSLTPSQRVAAESWGGLTDEQQHAIRSVANSEQSPVGRLYAEALCDHLSDLADRLEKERTS